MKKLLLAVAMLGMVCCAHAQSQPIYYYYQGQKYFVQETYTRLLVGVKNAASLKAGKNDLAANLQLAADSIIPSATPDEYIVHFSASQQGNAKALAQNISGKGNITYVHPMLVGQGSKLVSYGDAFTVKLKADATLSSLQSLLSKYNCTIVKQSAGDRSTYLISAGAPNNYDAIKTANLFYESGLFEYAQPNFTTHGGLAVAPNDPLYNLQWAHHNTGSEEQHNGTPGADMQVDSAWLITRGDTAIKIAVIDTGVDTAQADLKKNLLQGYNCITLTANAGDGMPLDSTNAHGTACAGIIAAAANNKIGIAGIAPNCKIIPVSITSSYSIFASDFAIAGGIDYSWQHGADVLTNSWTLGLPDATIDAAIHRAVTQGRGGKGCIVFFAAGNDNAAISYPSNLSDVIAVGGSTMCNQRKTENSCDGEYWWGASYGGGLDVVAPCVKIPTTDISGSAGYDTAQGAAGDYFLTFNGTSAAAPHAAAVAALVLSANKGLTGKDARTIVESNCTKGGNYSYAVTQGNFNGTWNNEMGYGIVNAYKSVLAAKGNKFCTAGIQTPQATTLCKNGYIKLSVADSNAIAAYTWRLNGSNIAKGATINATQAGIYDVVAVFPKCTAYAPPVVIRPADTAALQASAGKPVFICTGNNGVIIGGEPSASGGTPIVARQRAYGYDLLRGTFIRFNTDNPRDYTFKPVGSLDGTATTQFIAGDFTPLGYYAVDKSGMLSRIDTANGYVRFIGQLISESGQYVSHTWSGLGWDNVTKKLYGITSGGLANGVYNIDPVTGRAVRIAYIANGDISWGTFGGNGTMYVYANNYNSVGKYTLATNAVTYFGAANLGITNSLANLDGSIDPLNGKLYFSTYAYTQSLFGDLREIDTTTGKMNIKGGIAGIDEVAALAISGGTYKYAWAPATGLSNPNDANPIARPTTTTTYTLTVTDACGAKATSQVVVTTNAPKPTIKLTASKDSICVGDSSRLVATKNPNYTYQWSFNGALINNLNDTVFTVGRGGNVQVTVTNGRGGCTNTSPVFKVKDCSIWLNNFNADTACYSYLYPPHGFIDTGFRPGEAFTKTIYPANPGDRLKITFNYFKAGTFTELSIYDGPNTNGTLLRTMSFYDYLNQKISFTSSTGPLTFKFTNGTQPDNVGTWDAFLTCVTPHTYLSKKSGEFGDSSTWLIRTGDGGVTDAERIPNYTDDSIIIRKGHTLTVTNYPYNTYVDQVWLQKGATLIINNSLPFMYTGKFGLLADGDIVLQGYSQLNPGGDVYLRGNVTTSSANNYVGGNLIVDGTAPQVFTMARKSSINTIHLLNKKGLTIHGYAQVYNLYMNSPGGLIADSLDVLKVLHLDTGVIHINSPGVVNISEYGADYSPGNTKSYIDGAVVRNITSYTAATHYPVGTATQFRPVDLNFGKYVYDMYTVRAINGPVPVQPVPAGISNVNSFGYYKITSRLNAAIPALTVTLPYLKGDGVADPASLRMVRDSAGAWLNAGGVGTHKDTGTITSTLPVTHAGNFALANATGGTNPLPVTWLDVTAALQNNAVMVQWKIAQEINVYDYVVEHGTDGTHFNPLTRVMAYNDVSKGTSYKYLHTSPVNGANYYRIKEVDKDGRYMYSKTINILLADKSSITVTPNPAKDVVSIMAGDIIKEVFCYNATGQLVQNVTLSSNTCTLQLKQFASGVYTLKIITASATFNRKIIKQ